MVYEQRPQTKKFKEWSIIIFESLKQGFTLCSWSRASRSVTSVNGTDEKVWHFEIFLQGEDLTRLAAQAYSVTYGLLVDGRKLDRFIGTGHLPAHPDSGHVGSCNNDTRHWDQFPVPVTVTSTNHREGLGVSSQSKSLSKSEIQWNEWGMALGQ